MSDYLAGRIIRLWHALIVYRSYSPARDRFQCFHCGGWFTRQEVCGDHFPHTKGSRPDLRYDLENGVCSDMMCNVSNAPTRSKAEPKKVKKPPVCSVCRLRLATKNGKCPFCR
jgi:hypothetical protein